MKLTWTKVDERGVSRCLDESGQCVGYIRRWIDHWKCYASGSLPAAETQPETKRRVEEAVRAQPAPPPSAP